MIRYLDNMKVIEFDNFLKFCKKYEDTNNFKVYLKGGIDIFKQGEKISMIWIFTNNAGRKFVGGDVVFEIKNPNKRNILLSEKIEKTKEIYEFLIKKYKNA